MRSWVLAVPAPCTLALCTLALFAEPIGAQSRNQYKQTGSRRPYSHRIELQGADGRKIDPTATAAPPYSPRETCKKCHDVDAIAHGFHFNAATTDTHGRKGEPWIFTDPRTATQLPISYRGHAGTYHPSDVGLTPEQFVQTFGRHLSGGTRTYAGTSPDLPRAKLTGDLAIDCMFCHSAGNSFSHDVWQKQIASQNLAWASTAALGLAKITGSAKGLPLDLDPSSEDGKQRLPVVTYDLNRFDAEGKVFFDIVRQPTDAACYACHSNQPVGRDATPSWLHDGDVHLRAGMSCVDCHRNGIEHHTVRGYDGEVHPTDTRVETLSCRGCHMDTTDGHGEIVARGGRLGAPKPLHKGLPPLHFDKLACTACHSGSRSRPEAQSVQTALAHGLGLASQKRKANDLPLVVETVLARSEDGRIRPHRATWPSFWGQLTSDKITPIAPADAFKILRRALRIRKDLRAEIDKVKLTSEALRIRTWHEKLLAGFAALEQATPGMTAVFVSGGRVYKKGSDGIETFEHAAARPYLWPIGHDVRPARASTGASGCTECHAADAPFLHSTITARGPVPTTTAESLTQVETIGLDPELIDTWDITFEARGPSKWVQIVALSITTLVVLGLLLGTLLRLLTGRRRSDGEAS